MASVVVGAHGYAEPGSGFGYGFINLEQPEMSASTTDRLRRELAESGASAPRQDKPESRRSTLYVTAVSLGEVRVTPVSQT